MLYEIKNLKNGRIMIPDPVRRSISRGESLIIDINADLMDKHTVNRPSQLQQMISKGAISVSARHNPDTTSSIEVPVTSMISSGAGVSQIDFLLDNEPVDAVNTSYTIMRDGSNVVVNETWKRIDTTTIKTIDYSRDITGALSQQVVKIFDVDGLSILGQNTTTFVVVDSNLTSSTTVRNI